MNSPITEREHADLVARVDRLDRRQDKFDGRLDVIEAKVHHIEGMAALLRVIFGASVIGAGTSILLLLELVRHAGV